jgi:hypothetical protein
VNAAVEERQAEILTYKSARDRFCVGRIANPSYVFWHVRVRHVSAGLKSELQVCPRSFPCRTDWQSVPPLACSPRVPANGFRKGVRSRSERRQSSLCIAELGPCCFVARTFSERLLPELVRLAATSCSSHASVTTTLLFYSSRDLARASLNP